MDLSRAADLFAVLSHDRRFSLIVQLAAAGSEGLTVSELAKRTDITPRSVRNQMRRLEEAGLASVTKREGKLHCYVNRKEIGAFVNIITAVLDTGPALIEHDGHDKDARKNKSRVSREPRRLPLAYRSLRDKLSVVELAAE